MAALGVIALGVVVSIAGTGAHRAYGWVGVVLAVLLVGAAGVFARTWLSWLGLSAYATAWGVMTMVLAQGGPNNSVLIAGDAVGYAWLGGAVVTITLIALVPRRWLEADDVAS